MIEVLVKLWNKEKCKVVERLYKVESLTDYITRVKPNLLKALECCANNCEIIAEYIKVNF